MTAEHQDRARQALEAIAYSDDPSVPVTARTAALGELSRMPPPAKSVREEMSPAEVERELRDLAEASQAWLAIHRGPEAVEAPVEAGDLEAIATAAVELAEQQAGRIEDLEAQLRHERRNRLLAPVLEL